MIHVKDVAFVRYQAPDLDEMESFMEDFGLTTAQKTDDTLYMRTLAGAPFAHVTHKGPIASLGVGLFTKSMADLEKISESANVPVVPVDGPVPGFKVSLTEPSGFGVDLVYWDEHKPLRPEGPVARNTAYQRLRKGHFVREGNTPAHPVRLGHVVLRCKDFDGTMDFFLNVLGMRPSDNFHDGDPEHVMAAFLRCGLGKEWTDHHTIVVARAPDGISRIGHSAYEMIDIAEVLRGNNYLTSQNRKASWGVGRHIQGSQVFDYWRDPFGNQLEHWADGDLVNDDTPVGNAQTSPDQLYQWGPEPAADFFEPGPAISEQ
ncbi:catechol 2,3-dioxygenase [Hyphomonas adhaerens MHS-3]|uniref:Catechol 2,3-dioxygenase n=1 Tax=Hyphomonas adhaerens MHS-3 TaxID=1280949 RepID=A0A069E7B5_9PROT|nr:VOC family protein [Hyphomonas adhaerens]KCZ86008.1 catechol 2,3-dioxygenase [Hyphomonas adhaerens MHS-3]